MSNAGMANHAGRTLSRLVKDRAYLGGELKALDWQIGKLEPKMRALAARLDALAAERPKIAEKIALLDRNISDYAGTELTGIRSIRKVPRRFKHRHGTMMAGLVKILSDSAGPLTTEAIVTAMAQRFSLPMDTNEERQAARKAMGRKLRHLIRLGRIERLHKPGEMTIGLWLWKRL